MDINLHAFESLFWYQELDSYPLVNHDLPINSMVFFQFVM